MNSIAMGKYAIVKHLHKVVPAFSPYVPVGFLSYLVSMFLAVAFVLAVHFTTLPKSSQRHLKRVGIDSRGVNMGIRTNKTRTVRMTAGLSWEVGSVALMI
jgi:hypothetical protein